jgi:protein-tyrosine phosphatase
LVDLHCHILPRLDDGPDNLSECMEMANKAVKSGITDLFATPHHLNGLYENPKSDILARVLEVNNHLQEKNIPLKVHPGQELRIHREIFTSLEMGNVLTLDNKGQYLLLELPSGEVPSYTQEVIYELLVKGITPIIVHPERNLEFIQNNHLLFELIQEGALAQLTAGSITGTFGKKVKRFSKKLIEHHLVHFIASDAHNLGSRGFTLKEAYEMITSTFGIERTLCFRENADLLLSGQRVYIEQPIPIRKKILGFF